jgi:hypothetical protein
MKTLTQLLLLFLPFVSFSQTTMFNKKYNYQTIDSLERIEIAISIIQLPNGNYLLPLNAESSQQNTGFFAKYPFVIHTISNTGIALNTRAYNDTVNPFFPLKIKQLNDKNYLIVGGSNGVPAICKINSSGDTLFTRRYVDGKQSQFYDFAELKDKSVVNVGQYQGNVGTGQPTRALVTRVDSLGNVLWRTTFGTPAFNAAIAVAATTDSTLLLLAGHNDFGSSNTDIVLYMIDTTGALLWTKTYPTPNQEACNQMIATKDGNYLIAGGDLGIGLLMKIDALGNVIWRKTYGHGSAAQLFNGVAEAYNGDIVATGGYYTTYTDANGIHQITQGLVTRLDANGNELWHKTYPRTEDSPIFSSIIKTLDNGFIMPGYFTEQLKTYPNPIHTSTWLVKIDSLGCDTVGCSHVGITETNANNQPTLNLYPSITSAEATVTYTLPSSTHTACLQLYDITGVLLKTYQLNPHSTTYKLNVQDVTKGIKLAVLKTNEELVVYKKIVIN